VEKEESLETSALISKLTDSVKDKVDELLTNGVVTTGIVVGGILLPSDQLLGMEELAVCASTDLIYDSWFQIDEYSPGNVFASTGLAEEGVEGVVTTSNGLITWHLTIRLDAVFQAVQLPAGITDLDTGLTNVDGDTLTHFEYFRERGI